MLAKKKAAANPNFQKEALQRIRNVEKTLKRTNAPYVILTPPSPLIRKLFRAPDCTISPHEYGGWLKKGFNHPSYSAIVPPQDAYYKKTFVFTGGGFIIPRRKPVTPVYVEQQRKDGSVALVSPVVVRRKDANVRRLAPLGFLEAVAQTHPAT